MIMFFFQHHLEKEWYIVAICLSFCIYYVMYGLGQPNCPYSIYFFFLIKKKKKPIKYPLHTQPLPSLLRSSQHHPFFYPSFISYSFPRFHNSRIHLLRFFSSQSPSPTHSSTKHSRLILPYCLHPTLDCDTEEGIGIFADKSFKE